MDAEKPEEALSVASKLKELGTKYVLLSKSNISS